MAEKKYRITYETNERGEKACGDTNTVEAIGFDPYAAVAGVCKSDGPDRWGQDDVVLAEELDENGEPVSLRDLGSIFKMLIETYPQPYTFGLRGHLVADEAYTKDLVYENVVVPHYFELVSESSVTGQIYLGKDRRLVLREHRPELKNSLVHYWGYTIPEHKLKQKQSI